jgi:Transposase DDE domain
MIYSTDSLIVPLTADVTTANMSDNQVYPHLTASLSFSGFSEIITKADYMVADPGYDDQSLYESSLKLGFQLVCPVRRYKNTPEERLQLVDFYESPLGQAVYSKRRISVEPLIEHIKSIFRIDPVPTRGFDMVPAIVLLSVLL